MRDREFEFCFEGPEAQADAQALADFLKHELPDWPVRVAPLQPPPKPPGTRDAGTTIAILALILSLPGALKNAAELADRLKPQMVRLIAWAKDRRARRQRNPSIVLPPHGLKTPLDKVRPEQLLEAISCPDGAGQSQKP